MREKGVNKGEGKERGEKRNAEILPEVSNSSQSLLISAPWVGAPANENKDPLPPPQPPLSGPKVPILEVLGTKNNGERGTDPEPLLCLLPINSYKFNYLPSIGSEPGNKVEN